MNPSEADDRTRTHRITVRATEALGDGVRARDWLRAPNRALGGRTPHALLGSDEGARAVERVLGRIEHGIHG